MSSTPCTPQGPLESVRPASRKRLLFRYGPMHVTPGDNLILFGPITIERPLAAGYIVGFKPDLVRVDGTVPPIEILHPHHSVWISTAFSHPMFASREEKTIFAYLPGGMGSGFTPTVTRGEALPFLIRDAAAQIFHTVTSCAAPCTGTTGISYPLANGPADFDSLELGFGVTCVTAASYRADYSIDTSDFEPGEYTYFCRIHPPCVACSSSCDDLATFPPLG